jgi:hypothetical protein
VQLGRVRVAATARLAALHHALDDAAGKSAAGFAQQVDDMPADTRHALVVPCAHLDRPAQVHHHVSITLCSARPAGKHASAWRPVPVTRRSTRGVADRGALPRPTGSREADRTRGRRTNRSWCAA